MVTAELAVAIPAVVLVLACCVSALSAGMDQVRCVDAARAAARSAARGDSAAESRRLALRAAPRGAEVRVERGGAEVRVVVSVRAGGAGRLVPGWYLRAQAVGPVEAGVP
ncbi:TadE family type IV pilus minor pilin [Intrasporangium sp.]|uniref:TadE family type IV pilus minor pilin n=1 Tax=Intrasporangium sp. TaxID=1925024 RepID=UPI003222010F